MPASRNRQQKPPQKPESAYVTSIICSEVGGIILS